ncbi:unnamed protein product [Phaeothamnion confervicola]
MTSRGEDGYILASALAVLLAISLVAATLVSTSADSLRSVKKSEADAVAESALQSALVLVGSQLALDPRRRQLAFDDNTATIEVLGRSIDVLAAWENAKLDINGALVDDIDEALRNAGVDETERAAIRGSIQGYRSRKEQIPLVDDVLPGSSDRDCLYSLLTVFGGRTDYVADEQAGPVRIGRPAAGARLSVDLWLTDKPEQGIAAVVMMTGDPAAPVEVLDKRKLRAGGKERCHEN